MDQFEIRDFVRLGLIIIGIASAIFARLISSLIGSNNFLEITRKVFLFFLVAVIGRIISAVIDSQLDFQIGVASAAVNYLTNGYILYIMIKYWWDLKFQKSHIDLGGTMIRNPKYIDTQKAAPRFDEALRLLRLGNQKTEKLKKQLEDHISK